ncbi:LysR substrate-binding domain-containing protein [Paraburkholderia megapolitana]|nr:LysR substrate-binding domain-containing protein [Paraburkholderia megapolitana]
MDRTGKVRMTGQKPLPDIIIPLNQPNFRHDLDEMKAKIRPNFAALRALEAAERCRNFSLSAEELHLTHSAISHQIRQLEAVLGNTLFTRVGSEMIPTPACSRLAERLRRGLLEIDAALDEARTEGQPSRRQLSVSVMADFANVWFIPRLADFAQLHPDIDLTLTVHNDFTPPDPRSVDVGIWHRRIDERGFRSEKLMKDQVIAVCSPGFQKKHGPLSLDRLQDIPLLHFHSRSWREFFQAAGLTRAEPGPGPTFSDAASLLNASLAGLGVAMIREQLARTFLRSGALVQIGDVRIPAHLEYYFVWQEENLRESAIRCLYLWLQQGIETM